MPHPVVNFLRHSLTLKAAMAECADTPKPKSVHQLRSTTRRIEAILELLANTADLSNARRQERTFRRYLRKVRSAAGKVRDIDVHLEMLGAYKSITDTARLERDLSSARRKSATKLQRRILKDGPALRHALDNLESDLAPLVDLNLSGGSIAHSAQTWLATAIDGLDPHHDDGLHSIRKACKTARYMAEVGSESSKSAMKLAQRLNDVQQTTGAWHDCLLLLNEAYTSLPDDSPLIEKVRRKALRLRRQAEAKAIPLRTMRNLAPTPTRSGVH